MVAAQLIDPLSPELCGLQGPSTGFVEEFRHSGRSQWGWWYAFSVDAMDFETSRNLCFPVGEVLAHAPVLGSGWHVHEVAGEAFGFVGGQ